MKKLYALRGATQCLNTIEDIGEQTARLYDELLTQNKLVDDGKFADDDIVSLIFSVTRDLDAANPAAALRRSGRGQNLALFVVQEAETAGALERTIRILIHCYLEEGSIPRHVYRNGAEILRPDRSPSGAPSGAPDSSCTPVISPQHPARRCPRCGD
ncbi:chorismate mutase [Spirochaetia bacterium]|nr:chorismate mutase [Spirochaetia bacterium]